jgi:hypothetical protein
MFSLDGIKAANCVADGKKPALERQLARRQVDPQVARVVPVVDVKANRAWQLWLAEKAISHALLVGVPVPVIPIRFLFDAPNLIEQN